MKIVTVFASLLLCAAAALAQNPVTFQVQMSVQEQLGNFNPATDQVVVRGNFNGWGGNNPTLTDAGEMLYSGSYDVGDELIDQLVEYKFVIISAEQGDVWESVDNRSFTLPAGGATIDPVWFNDQDSAGELTNVEVLFRVNMEVMIANGTFDPAADWIVIRGNHANIGNWGGAVVMDEEGGNPGHYFLNIQFDGLEVDSNLEFKYVILENQDELLARWEGVANRMVNISNDWPDSDSDGYGEFVLDEAWFDNVTWDDIISQDVTVHFAVNLWPVQQWFAENPAEENQGLTSYEEITFVAVCGPWNNWPWDLVPPEYQLTPTTGTWFEGDILFNQYSSASIVFKYGANGHDNEAGFQADHTAIIDDATGEDSITRTFGELGDWWLTSVEELAPRPASLEIARAWPNPFNPAATIEYSLRSSIDVRLSVVNLLGETVAVLSEGRRSAGTHHAVFDGRGLASGVYLAVLEGGGERASQKLLLVK
jgi:hypothetical protein